jgi:hypothetical protein
MKEISNISPRIPGQRRIIAGGLDIDYGCFEKTEERFHLRLAKLQRSEKR